MYRCNSCIYKNGCQGACGSKTCDGYKRDNDNNRKQMAEDQKIREQNEATGLKPRAIIVDDIGVQEV